MLLVTLRGIEYPSTYSNWMDLTLNYPKKQRISHLWRTGLSALHKNSQYIPNVVLSGTQKESTLPFLNSRYQNQETLF